MLLVLVMVLTAMMVMIVIGRRPVHFLIAPIGVAATYLLRMLPTLLRLLPVWQILRGKMNYHRATTGGAQRQSTRLQTSFLSMELDHGSGDMDGAVLQGTFAGKKLSRLTLTQLQQLVSEVAVDLDSHQVLEAYLDRMHPDWREAGEQAHRTISTGESVMTRSLALEILGLPESATIEQINQAHRKLMQKLHPDRGGSDYLAKRINSARDYLEDKR
jgi:hypothetical protein